MLDNFLIFIARFAPQTGLKTTHSEHSGVPSRQEFFTGVWAATSCPCSVQEER